MRYFALIFLVLLPVTAFAAVKQETRELELPAAGINILRIQCGAGGLILRGIEGLDKIEVSADILVQDLQAEDLKAYFENNVLLDLIKRGKKAVLLAEFLRSSRIKPLEARIDLLVRVPRNMTVRIDDGSGPVHASGFHGNFEIDDGSGTITIRDITGKVRVGDTSGPVTVEAIIGNVDIKDGSGSIDINSVAGNVSVVDASGSITIQDVDGYVKVSDGSGSIDIHDVSKNVTILESDSGEINIEGVKGRIIRRDENASEIETEPFDDVE
jgi:hypothetical protein